MVYQILIVLLSFAFITVVFVSVYKNKKEISFYRMITRDDGRISKVGISFIFVQMLIIFQVVTGAHVDSYLTELLAVIFAAEVGTKYVDRRQVINNYNRSARGKPVPKLSDED
jgi:uncharacterized membrane protein